MLSLNNLTVNFGERYLFDDCRPHARQLFPIKSVVLKDS